VIKGADTVYGRFGGGNYNGYGLWNYNTAARDYGIEKGLGFTAVRLCTTPDAISYLGATEFWKEMDNVINLATNQNGFVVIISQDGNSTGNMAVFDGQVAARYKNNPRVWLKNNNEPDPYSSWATWRAATQAEVNAIRQAGNTQPIVLNAPNWSWDFSQYPNYPINDSNLILGPHLYQNKATNIDIAGINAAWAGMTARGYAVYMDEWGNDNGPGNLGTSTWNQQLGDFLANWTNTAGGSGALGFNWYWSSGNAMTDGNGNLIQWGQDFQNHFVSKVR
jgi:cellulase (glycosyl hydrolase family 5)